MPVCLSRTHKPTIPHNGVNSRDVDTLPLQACSRLQQIAAASHIQTRCPSHRRIGRLPWIPHGESTLQFVTSPQPVTSCNTQIRSSRCGNQKRAPQGCIHRIRQFVMGKIILSPFPFGTLSLPFPRLFAPSLDLHALRADICLRAASVLLHGADLLALRKSLRTRQPYGSHEDPLGCSCRSRSIVSRTTEAMLAVCSAVCNLHHGADG